MAAQYPIDYTSKDFDGFKASLLDYASRAMPEWSQASEGDFGMLFVEMFAYEGDILSYYGDQIAQEAFLPTARLRRSVLNHAQMLAYTPHGNLAATGTVTFQTSNPGSDVLVPAGTQVSTDFQSNLDAPVVYETDSAVVIPGNGGLASVSVTQGQTISGEVIATSDGTIDQQYRLFQTPVIDDTVRVFIGDDINGFGEWGYYPHIIDANPQDDAFSTFTDDQGVVWIQFGDGVNGRVPDVGATIKVIYRVGGGTVGNIAAGKVTTIVTTIDGVTIALDASGTPQTSAMTNGQDAESIEQIRANAPQSYQTQNRCVSLLDYQSAALGVSAVTKAKAVANTFTNITVFVVGPDGSAPDALVQAANEYLNDPIRKMGGGTVTAAPGAAVPVDVALTLGVLPQYSRANVQTAVTTAVQELLSMQNVDFGARISLSSVYQAVASVPGVQYASITGLVQRGGPAGVVADVVLRDWQIPSIGNVTISQVAGGF